MKLKHLLMFFLCTLPVSCNTGAVDGELDSCGLGYVNKDVVAGGLSFTLLYNYYIEDGGYTYYVLATTDEATNSYDSLVQRCKTICGFDGEAESVVLYTTDSNIYTLFANDLEEVKGISFYRPADSGALTRHTYIKDTVGFSNYGIIPSAVDNKRVYLNDTRAFLLNDMRLQYPGVNAYYLFTSRQYDKR